MAQPPTIEDLENRVMELEKQVRKKTFSEQLTQTLFHVSDAVNTFTDLDKLFPFIYQALDQIMGLPNFYIAANQKDQSFINIPFCVIENEHVTDTNAALFDTGSLVQEVLEKNHSLVLNQDQLKNRIKNIEDPPKIWMGVPLIQRKKPFGVIAIFDNNNPDAFDQKDMDILITVSHQIALAIERNQSFDELNMVKNYMTNIINSMPSILVGVDKHQRVTQWNLMAELETGLKEIEAKQKDLIDVFPRLSAYHERIQNSILSRKIKTCLKQEYLSGQEKRFEDIIIYPLTSNGVEGCVIRIDDITEQVCMEDMVLQSEKMMSIGGFAAGMAHEIKNPLAGMMQHAQVVYNRITKDIPANNTAAKEAGISMAEIRTYMEKRKITDSLKTINETGSRATGIIKNILGFARKSEPVLIPQNLSTIMKETIELAQKDYNLNNNYRFDSIRILEQFEDIPDIPCDKGKLQQVLFNILKNGAQAMSDIEDKNYTPQFILRLSAEDKMACLEIENNGPNISEETQKKLFEPFYTTKSGSTGTGLGLSISYFIIVTDHKGEMAVKSAPGKTTCFSIKLPY